MKFNILFSPKRAERHPIEMMIIGIVYSSLALFVSILLFPSQQSPIVMVFFTVISCIYVIQGAIKIEETKDRGKNSEQWKFKHHLKLLFLLLFLFMGFVISFSFWTFILPTNQVSTYFSMQELAVQGVRQSLTGNAVSAPSVGFFPILINNLKVLLTSLLLAFFFGAGAIYVLAWNASVMGFVIGNIAKESLGLIAIPIVSLKYFIHGIPEMLGYFTAALAGGIIYVAILRGDVLKNKRLIRILIDVFVLILVSVILLILGAALEVYVSPYV